MFSTTSKLVLCTLILVSTVAWLLRFCSIHRVYSTSDALEIVSVALLPIYPKDRRCKQEDNRLRCLPDVFVIGASKAGTTSFISYLQRYPNISMLRRRIHRVDKHSEVHRFDRSNFAIAYRKIELLHEWASTPSLTSPYPSVVHYTPHYLYAPTVPFDMREFYPHLSSASSHKEREIENSFTNSFSSLKQFVILLRDPVDRMMSSYWFKNSHLFQPEDRGSLLDMANVLEKQKRKRLDYEVCMIKHFLKQRLLASSRVPTALREYCTREKIATSSQLRITCKYLSIIAKLLSLFMDCDVERSTRRHAERRDHYFAGSSLFWRSRCQRRADLTLPMLAEARKMLWQGLEHCHGQQGIRSKELGLHHLEKSIYFDQILRWWVNFPSTNSYLWVSSEGLFLNASIVMNRVYQQLQEHSRPAQGETIPFNQSDALLSRPNRYSFGLENSTFLQDMRKQWKEFFDIYNQFLFTILLK